MIRLFIFSFLLLSTEIHAREASREDYLERDRAKLAILDKITARVENIELQVGENTVLGSLELKLERCLEPPMEFTPETLAYVHLAENTGDDTPSTSLFSGWMFASSPGLSALEHPVYDVWVVDCL